MDDIKDLTSKLPVQATGDEANAAGQEGFTDAQREVVANIFTAHLKQLNETESKHTESILNVRRETRRSKERS